ncbi:hypothetical protein, partial [Streptomyces sp. ADI95-17]|uniref:hypothetical protein n=1 Tax=Streptomyces sp. ADI95-17 TaxID=1522759 RepID=UPI0019CFE67B
MNAHQIFQTVAKWTIWNDGSSSGGSMRIAELSDGSSVIHACTGDGAAVISPLAGSNRNLIII